MASGLTPTYLLPYPLQTDSVDVANDMKLLAEASETAFSTKASIASPALTGIPTAPTAAADTNTTQLATTQFVISQGYLKTASAIATYAPLANPAFTGNPTAPTQTAGNSSTRLATTEFTGTAITNHSGLSSGVHGVGSGNIVGTTLTQTLTNKTIDGGLNTLQNIPVSAITNLASSYAPLNLSFKQSTISYTLELGNAASQVEMNVGTANTVTIPTDASVSFPIGTTILIAQIGSGQTTVVPASGVTLNATPGAKLRTQWSVATLVKRNTNVWLLSGDVVA